MGENVTFCARSSDVAQTFLSAVAQVFQPAGRVGNSRGCLAIDALPTGKSAERQTRMSALRPKVVPCSWRKK